MQHDLQLRAAARLVYDACYAGEEWTSFTFDEAKRYKTVHYRQVVGAAQAARSSFAIQVEPPRLLVAM